MAQQNRVNLKSFFQTGFKPTQQNFADLIDSFPNKDDDGISADASKNITLNNGLTIGNSSLEIPGSIRWNGTTFQFRDTTGWKDIGSGSGSQWTTVGADINLLTGNAAIGLPAATSPTYKFEVNLGASGTVADQVRLGAASFFMTSSAAFMSHINFANANSYALSHDALGRVTLNCASGQRIQFQENNVLKAAIVGGALCINATAVPANSNATPILLFVNGDAAKPGGGQFVNLSSDERVKSDIKDFNDGLAKLKKLKPVNYKYNGKAGIVQGKEYTGLIAQDVQKIFPYMVGNFKAKMEPGDEQETELLSLDTSALTYVMLNAIKELDARVLKLEKK
ncbi:tail fiber domain-containing protein [Parafilimonas sp.]|uniref:tail fiber domain-containing protein n=1 Tax=Parafilimonas sp. TaxID=1969739 RepID=UPI0039E61088